MCKYHICSSGGKWRSSHALSLCKAQHMSRFSLWELLALYHCELWKWYMSLCAACHGTWSRRDCWGTSVRAPAPGRLHSPLAQVSKAQSPLGGVSHNASFLPRPVRVWQQGNVTHATPEWSRVSSASKQRHASTLNSCAHCQEIRLLFIQNKLLAHVLLALALWVKELHTPSFSWSGKEGVGTLVRLTRHYSAEENTAIPFIAHWHSVTVGQTVCRGVPETLMFVSSCDSWPVCHHTFKGKLKSNQK